MAGYRLDYKMSNNAAAAYDSGEKPISKWTKTEILDLCGEKRELLATLTAAELRSEMLYKSSWHHTSCKYNATDFYSFDEDRLEEIDAEQIAEIVKSRAPKKSKETKSDEILTAEITYTIWEGKYARYRKPRKITEIVRMKRGDKMVMTSQGNKRVGCLDEVKFL